MRSAGRGPVVDGDAKRRGLDEVAVVEVLEELLGFFVDRQDEGFWQIRAVEQGPVVDRGGDTVAFQAEGDGALAGSGLARFLDVAREHDVAVGAFQRVVSPSVIGQGILAAVLTAADGGGQERQAGYTQRPAGVLCRDVSGGDAHSEREVCGRQLAAL